MVEHQRTGENTNSTASQRIVAIRAYVREDQIDPGPAHIDAIDDPENRSWEARNIASPLSRHPGFEVRTVGGPAWVGDVVVEVESAEGQTGIGVSIGGAAACVVVERHLSQFVLGRQPAEMLLIWDLMWQGSQFYGRKGLVLHAISALDLAIWDLHGKQLGQPVYASIGGPVRERLDFYATTPNPAVVASSGFIGCKIPLSHGLASGRDGLRRNVEEFARARSEIGNDLFLALDCWMGLDVETAIELAERLLPYGPEWLEECLLPDDYWGYARLREHIDASIALAGGEHEATRWGFRALSEFGKCDLLQPDPTWCGGLTELLRIVEDAQVAGKRIVTHGASAYGMHLAFARDAIPFAECILTGIGGAVKPFFGDLFLNEPLPVRGTLELERLGAPGFGLELNPSCRLVRPNVSLDVEV